MAWVQLVQGGRQTCSSETILLVARIRDEPREHNSGEIEQRTISGNTGSSAHHLFL